MTKLEDIKQRFSDTQTFFHYSMLEQSKKDVQWLIKELENRESNQ